MTTFACPVALSRGDECMHLTRNERAAARVHRWNATWRIGSAQPRCMAMCLAALSPDSSADTSAFALAAGDFAPPAQRARLERLPPLGRPECGGKGPALPPRCSLQVLPLVRATPLDPRFHRRRQASAFLLDLLSRTPLRLGRLLALGALPCDDTRLAPLGVILPLITEDRDVLLSCRSSDAHCAASGACSSSSAIAP